MFFLFSLFCDFILVVIKKKKPFTLLIDIMTLKLIIVRSVTKLLRTSGLDDVLAVLCWGFKESANTFCDL